MATTFIDGQFVILPVRFAAGDTIGPAAAALLCDIQHRRVKARLRYLLDRGEIAPHELQAKAEELCCQELTVQSTFADDDDNADPILDEALIIARELIVSRMAKEGILPPKGLDNHARALVEAVPEIQERARLRVEARYAAANSALTDIE